MQWHWWEATGVEVNEPQYGLGSHFYPMLRKALATVGRAIIAGKNNSTDRHKTGKHNGLSGFLKTDEIDLDGSWHFETADKAFVQSVAVPGAWQSQGIGTPTALLHHQYIGVGTYSKTVDLSQRLANSTCWLWIGGAPGGVVRSAIISANGQRVGRHVGYIAPVEMQLPCTRKLNLSVAVDSRWNMTEDPLYHPGLLSQWNRLDPGNSSMITAELR
jgi:hypothetical protein